MTTHLIHYPEDAGKKFEMFRYPAGELQVRLLPPLHTPIPWEDRIIVYATIKDGEIMGLALLLDAIQWRWNTYLVLPYLPYSRADRVFVQGDCHGLGVFGQIVNTILRAHRTITLDAHSSQARRCVNELVDVSPLPLIDKTFESLGKCAILLPDEGASRYGFEALRCKKLRDPKTGKLSGFEVPPRSAFEHTDSILIVDDICDGGGTFIGLAEKLKEYNKPLYLYVTHGIFSKGLEGLLKYYSHIYTTDSFKPKPHDGLTIYPAEPLLLEAIKEQS